MNLTFFKAGIYAAAKLITSLAIAILALYLIFFALEFIACFLLLKDTQTNTEEATKTPEFDIQIPSPPLLLTTPLIEQEPLQETTKTTEKTETLPRIIELQGELKPSIKATSKAKSKKTQSKPITEPKSGRNPLEKMSKPQLQAQCRERKIKGYSKLSKPELIALLTA
jgi:hypothetical protein